MTRQAKAGSRVERLLTSIALVIAVISLVAFVTVMIAEYSGLAVTWSSPFWLTTFFFAYYGLPIALVFVIGLIIWRVFSNKRANRAVAGDVSTEQDA